MRTVRNAANGFRLPDREFVLKTGVIVMLGLGSIFRKEKKREHKSFDREQVKPVIRCSICNGEQVAGFQNLQTKKFEEVMILRNPQDLQDFMEQYGITEKIEKIY